MSRPPARRHRRRTERPGGGFPPIPRDAPPGLRRWMEAAQEAMGVRYGRRGDPYESAVTFQHLVDSGLALDLRRGIGMPVIIPVPRPQPGGGAGVPGMEYGEPPAVTGLHALGVYGGVHVIWDRPDPMERPDISFVEVRRGDTPDFADAHPYGGINAGSFFDVISGALEETWYYWVRFLSINGLAGPWAGPAEATKPADVDWLLARLSGEINASHFVAALNDRIALIDGPPAMPGSVNARIQDAVQALEAEDQALAARLTQLQSQLDDGVATAQQQLTAGVNQADDAIDAFASDITTVQAGLGDNVASVQQSLESRLTSVDGEILAMGAAYTLQIDNNGRVSGYTTYNDGGTSAMVFHVDEFAIGSPATPDTFPFMLIGNTAWLDTAVIRDASIQEGSIGSISFGKLVDNTGAPITTAGGVLRADMADFSGVSVTNAMIQNLAVTRAKIAGLAVTQAKIGDLAVDTLKVAGNAVSIPVASRNTSGGGLSQSWTQVTSVSYSSNGFPKVIEGSVTMSMGTQGLGDMQLRRGSTVLRSIADSGQNGTMSAVYSIGTGTIVARDSFSGTGTVSYNIRAKLNPGYDPGITTPQYAGGSLYIQEVKR